MTLRDDLLLTLRQQTPRTTEDLALKLLALRSEPVDATPLVAMQRKDGAWSAFPSAGPPNVFHTALALIALRYVDGPIAPVDRGFAWLESVAGYESHWLWKWKFRFFDRQVQFDPSKSGWPWVPGTVSWVAPTSLAMLAYGAWGRSSPRIKTARAMLFDRACPGGGWNAGNGVVFNVALDPHPDFTAMSLLALRSPEETSSPVLDRALDYLSRRAKTAASAYTLAWCAIALAAHSRAAPRVPAPTSDQPVHVTALTALALEDAPFTLGGSTQ